MSIIAEALKKAEEKRSETQGVQRTYTRQEYPVQKYMATGTPRIKAEPRMTQRTAPKARNRWLALAAACVIVLGAYATWNLLSRARPPSGAQASVAVKYETGLPVTPPRQEVSAGQSQDLKLQPLDVLRSAEKVPESFSSLNVFPTASIESARARLSSPPPLALSGIMCYANARYAIINDRMIEEGDTVNGAKVVKISKTDVRVKYNDSEITLSLNQ
jgi:hypothetical protein